ncbi:hypothetical protein NEOKW01_1632 [Nematocida sp. AWRm80]|nr:hypothetical protein NEOKW01_1632 [Nematocida sp. AWRm80]
MSEHSEERANGSEGIERYTELNFSGVPTKIHFSQILEHIIEVDILGIERTENSILVSFFSYYDMFRVWKRLGNEIQIDNTIVKIHPVKDNRPLEEKERLYLAHAVGGTRNIMLMNLEDYMNGEFIREEAEKYGKIEELKYFKDRCLAYILFYSFESAIKFISAVYEDSLFSNIKIACGRDKCNPEKQNTGVVPDELVHQNNRTIYLGNISVDTTPRDILKEIKGGQVFMIKIIRDKKCAFVTYFDYVSAAAFLKYIVQTPIYIHGAQPKIGVGKAQQLPGIAPIVAYSGATRVFSIQFHASLTEAALWNTLSRYGDLERLEKTSNTFQAYYLSVIDAFIAYNSLKQTSLNELLNRFEEDPCNTPDRTALMLEIQEREFECR